MSTALVIDGAYFLRRFKKAFPKRDPSDPQAVAKAVEWLAFYHVATRITPSVMNAKLATQQWRPEESEFLYRIFFYDCPPLTKKMHYPVSGKAIDLSRSPEAEFRFQFHDELTKVRKVALRLGQLNERHSAWRPKPDAVKQWLQDGESWQPTDNDFELDVVQKGVDMRLGLDVASMAAKGRVDQIVMVAADADFIPAIKTARREGIDVVVDLMGGSTSKELLRHVDGIRNAKEN